MTEMRLSLREDRYLFVIASLNALAFRRGNLFLNDWFRNPSFGNTRLPRLSFGKPRNDKDTAFLKRDCHGLPKGAPASMGIGFDDLFAFYFLY
jgi:hypothetical protein